ncbi:MAG TPA: ABC transporter substrate-binding protein, partial [Woeseiaceae bacterium]|nr:ABC transporter substrate-binding protein [Woeseiaceae bacterium]
MSRSAGIAALLILLASCDPEPDTRSLQRDAGGKELRIVTLAPHLAELVFAVGAGDMLVGVSSFTDYPEAALQLPVVSDAFVTDRELLALLQPDMLLAWDSGTPVHVIDELRAAGFRMEVIRTRSLGDVGSAMLQIGELTGHTTAAQLQARAYEEGIAQRRMKHAGAKSIRVFYQVSMHPL